MIKAIEVEALEDRRLRIRFEDGIEGVVDLQRYAGRGVFRIWDEPGVFEQAHLGASGEIEWTDEVAICSDPLYLEVTGKSVEDLYPNAKEPSLGA